MKLASVLLLSLPLFVASACQQGEGDFCQVTVDCASGLECNAGTQRCQKPGSGGNIPDAAVVVLPDAAPVVDAAPADAAASDAAPSDAGADASADAAPPV